jgi:hypothetical protein
MPNKINEIVIGPLNPLQTDCILEVIESLNNPFRILNKYIFPNFLTHMVTLAVITPSPYILRPGDLVAKLCTVTTEQALGEINGKNNFKSENFYNLIRFSTLDVFYSDSEHEEEEEEEEKE